ncbi:MAG: NUDIX hydrolase [Burkholderiales bacterium]|nr:NUDIX hydrolase [Burkholderiales bacterium]OJX04989.1 MAG: NUDIX hydrolase [Burkholderiales bacterium 70-64]
MHHWKPNTTVAAVIECDGRFLLVEEITHEGLRLNQPAGHLDPGESLLQAVAREALEETAWEVEPVAGVGVYMARYRHPASGTDVTYLRFAFACRALAHRPARALDEGIVRALWLDADEVRARRDEHRSPFVMRTIDDYLAGKRFALELIHTDPSCLSSDV